MIIQPQKYQAIVIGVSSGAYHALNTILPDLKSDLPVPIIIVRHLHHNSDTYAVSELNKKCQLLVKAADEKLLYHQY